MQSWRVVRESEVLLQYSASGWLCCRCSMRAHSMWLPHEQVSGKGTERDKSGQSLDLLSNAVAHSAEPVYGSRRYATADKEPKQIYVPIRNKE